MAVALERLRARRMSRADLPAVVAIERRSFPRPWSVAAFERELDLPWSTVEVAVEQTLGGERIVGYVAWWRVADEVHLMNVAVHPDARRRGVGRWLVDRVLAAAGRVRARAVLLEVRCDNTGARRLYDETGFRPIGLRRGYYGPGQDALVLERALGGLP